MTSELPSPLPKSFFKPIMTVMTRAILATTRAFAAIKAIFVIINFISIPLIIPAIIIIPWPFLNILSPPFARPDTRKKTTSDEVQFVYFLDKNVTKSTWRMTNRGWGRVHGVIGRRGRGCGKSFPYLEKFQKDQKFVQFGYWKTILIFSIWYHLLFYFYQRRRLTIFSILLFPRS